MHIRVSFFFVDMCGSVLFCGYLVFDLLHLRVSLYVIFLWVLVVLWLHVFELCIRGFCGFDKNCSYVFVLRGYPFLEWTLVISCRLVFVVFQYLSFVQISFCLQELPFWAPDQMLPKVPFQRGRWALYNLLTRLESNGDFFKKHVLSCLLRRSTPGSVRITSEHNAIPVSSMLANHQLQLLLPFTQQNTHSHTSTNPLCLALFDGFVLFVSL